MNFKKKRILMKAFVEAQFRVMLVYEFHTNGNSFEDVCWVSVWSYLSLRVFKKSQFLWRHSLSPTLKLCHFISFKQKWILLKTFVESQFEVMSINKLEKNANFDEHISWASVCSCVSLWVSNKSQFLRRHILGLSLKVHKLISFEPKWILLKTFVESQFEVM